MAVNFQEGWRRFYILCLCVSSYHRWCVFSTNFQSRAYLQFQTEIRKKIKSPARIHLDISCGAVQVQMWMKLCIIIIILTKNKKKHTHNTHNTHTHRIEECKYKIVYYISVVSIDVRSAILLNFMQSNLINEYWLFESEALVVVRHTKDKI